jgi:hypothetical protein
MPQNNGITSTYYSGQGIVLVATRDVLGAPEGFVNIGNVVDLSIAIEVSKTDHKESTTGKRAIDLSLTTEQKVTASMTLENINSENLALVLSSSASTVAAGAVVDEVSVAKLGKTLAMDNMGLSAVVIQDVTDTTTYILNDNYTINAEVGSINILTNAEQVAAGAANLIAEDDVLHIDYSFATYNNVEALTGSEAVRWLRFEGLNTALSDSPVVVDIFKMSINPLAELALINEELGQLVVASDVLSDSLRTTGSKFFRERLLV